MRIIQISDTHLSPGKAHFADNWAPLARWIVEQYPDLVIHTGDVTVDGADVEEDIRSGAELMRGLGVRFRAVPGNHDVGDAGHTHQPVNEERLQRWRTHFGPDRWVEDIEDWRLIGLDALLIGSGEREEGGQADWLDGVMNDTGSRRIAWFLHRPLFLDSPSEGDTGYWSIKPQPRAQLLHLVKRHSLHLGALYGVSRRPGNEGAADAWREPAWGRRLRHRRRNDRGRNQRSPGSPTALDRRRRRRGLPARSQQVSGGKPRKPSREPADGGKAQR
jgi:3',5'-cyclic AMP phosphodiesterase CpdA